MAKWPLLTRKLYTCSISCDSNRWVKISQYIWNPRPRFTWFIQIYGTTMDGENWSTTDKVIKYRPIVCTKVKISIALFFTRYCSNTMQIWWKSVYSLTQKISFRICWWKNFTARRVCIARTMLWQDVCLFVCPSFCPFVCLFVTRSILQKRLNISSNFISL